MEYSLQAAQDPGRLKPELQTTSSFVRVWSSALRLPCVRSRLKPELQTTTFVYGKAIDGTVAKKFRFRSLSIAQA